MLIPYCPSLSFFGTNLRGPTCRDIQVDGLGEVGLLDASIISPCIFHRQYGGRDFLSSQSALNDYLQMLFAQLIFCLFDFLKLTSDATSYKSFSAS